MTRGATPLCSPDSVRGLQHLQSDDAPGRSPGYALDLDPHELIKPQGPDFVPGAARQRPVAAKTSVDAPYTRPPIRNQSERKAIHTKVIPNSARELHKPAAVRLYTMTDEIVPFLWRPATYDHITKDWREG